MKSARLMWKRSASQILSLNFAGSIVRFREDVDKVPADFRVFLRVRTRSREWGGDISESEEVGRTEASLNNRGDDVDRVEGFNVLEL